MFHQVHVQTNFTVLMFWRFDVFDVSEESGSEMITPPWTWLNWHEQMYSKFSHLYLDFTVNNYYNRSNLCCLLSLSTTKSLQFCLLCCKCGVWSNCHIALSFIINSLSYGCWLITFSLWNIWKCDSCIEHNKLVQFISSK